MKVKYLLYWIFLFALTAALQFMRAYFQISMFSFEGTAPAVNVSAVLVRSFITSTIITIGVYLSIKYGSSKKR